MSAPPSLTVYVVRHGETDSNLQGIIQGHLDVPLNDTGRSQARLLSQSLRTVPFTRAWSSDLIRASDTAVEVLREHPNVELTKDVALRERFLGQWQGKSATERHAASKSDADGLGIEPPGELRARLMGWWSNNIAAYAGKAEAHLVVSHGYAISILLQGLISDGTIVCAPGVRVGHLPNTCVSIIDLNADGRGVLVKHGDDSHLTAAHERALDNVAEGDV